MAHSTLNLTMFVSPQMFPTLHIDGVTWSPCRGTVAIRGCQVAMLQPARIKLTRGKIKRGWCLFSLDIFKYPRGLFHRKYWILRWIGWGGVSEGSQEPKIRSKTIRKFGKNRKTAQKWSQLRTVGILGTEKPNQNFGKTEKPLKNRLEPQNRKPLTPPSPLGYTCQSKVDSFATKLWPW